RAVARYRAGGGARRRLSRGRGAAGGDRAERRRARARDPVRVRRRDARRMGPALTRMSRSGAPHCPGAHTEPCFLGKSRFILEGAAVAAVPRHMLKTLLRIPALLLPLALVWCTSSPEPHTDPPLPTDPDLLVAPPSGQGFQFKTSAVAVPAGTEEQDCYFFRVRDLAASGGMPANDPVQLHHVQIVQK